MAPNLRRKGLRGLSYAFHKIRAVIHHQTYICHGILPLSENVPAIDIETNAMSTPRPLSVIVCSNNWGITQCMMRIRVTSHERYSASLHRRSGNVFKNSPDWQQINLSSVLLAFSCWDTAGQRRISFTKFSNTVTVSMHHYIALQWWIKRHNSLYSEKILDTTHLQTSYLEYVIVTPKKTMMIYEEVNLSKRWLDYRSLVSWENVLWT